ncbi:MAG: 23S rRNA (uracil(1939)-C(5))-methyltransferase RlmD [Clostridia bacterium]
MKKNDIIDIEIVDNGMNFEGIGKVEDKVVFVPDAIIGERIVAKIVKENRSYAIGKIDRIENKSVYRKEPFCEASLCCGGCSAQHIAYDFQLILKTKMVENVLKKLKIDVGKIENIVGMGMPYYYRNKAQYPVSVNENGDMIIGFYAKRSHSIVQNKCCYIQNRVIDIISKEVIEKLIEAGFSGYDELKKTGDICHIVIRRGYHTKETMIVIVVSNIDLLNDTRFPTLVHKLIEKNNTIKSIYLNLNDDFTNKILGDKQKLVYGEKYIHDKIGKYMFKISSKSFFQVNTIQAEVLYHILQDKLELKGNEVLFDLYSGVGSIGIFLSESVKQVYGIEIETESVEMANLNILDNNVSNAEYIVGSVEEKIEEFKEKNIHPDVIVIDPPRKGLDDKTKKYLIDFNPKKIGYISCNPSTLARDLKELSKFYTIDFVTPVDMFPHTTHVECVCVLELKKS